MALYNTLSFIFLTRTRAGASHELRTTDTFRAVQYARQCVGMGGRGEW